MLGHLPALLAAFFASLVEFVEALTVVLAVGAVRGWRPAVGGAFAALALLAGIVLVFGPFLGLLPLRLVRLIIGVFLLTMGLRWLKKAVLRAAGRMKLRDEAANYARAAAELRGLDKSALATAFNITMVEGMEVVFIVLAIGAGAPALLPAAILGALSALALVVALGLALHQPLAKLPENTLKFATAVLLVAFGIFWLGEAAWRRWPGGDFALVGLIVTVMIVSLAAVRLVREK